MSRSRRSGEPVTFQGKVAAVTGGAAGIGAACVRALAAAGASVAVIDRDGPQAEALAATLGERGLAVAADVADGGRVARAFEQVAERFGGLDILVGNAGIQRYGTVETITEQQWDEVLGVNLRGAFLAAKHAVPLIRARGGGAIVFMGSAQSAMGRPDSAHYVASKHGLLGLTRAMALDHAPDRIRVNCVLPGTVDTPMLQWAAGLADDPLPSSRRPARSTRSAASRRPTRSPRSSPSSPGRAPRSSRAPRSRSTAD